MEEKFNKYFNLFYRDVYRLAFSYTLNYSDSKDIVQETFIKLYKNMNKFKENTDVEIKRWLMVVVSNNCKDYLKSFWKRKVKNLAEENQSFVNYDKEILDMLQQLDKKYRIPLFLYYYEGYKISEIAKILREKESTIKMRLANGKKMLKKEMETA